MRKPLFLSILLLSLAGLSAQAAPALDQEFAPASPTLYTEFSELTRAQTFTVGAAGLLSRFEVLIQSNSPGSTTGLFEIHPTVAGVPVLGSDPLASAIVTYGTSEGLAFYGADISSFGIMVSAGDVLAIVNPGHQPDYSARWWAGMFTGDHYAGGQFYTNVSTLSPPGVSSAYILQTGSDLGFRTYVDSCGPAPIPAPGALLLVGIGLVCTASRRPR